MNVIAIKLVSGEEVIGEEVSDGFEEVTVKNPVLVVMRPTGSGEMGLTFVPFMPYVGTKNFIFHHTKIIFSTPVDDAMRNQYSSVFGGIITPPKTLITG